MKASTGYEGLFRELFVTLLGSALLIGALASATRAWSLSRHGARTVGTVVGVQLETGDYLSFRSSVRFSDESGKERLMYTSDDKYLDHTLGSRVPLTYDRRVDSELEAVVDGFWARWGSAIFLALFGIPLLSVGAPFVIQRFAREPFGYLDPPGADPPSGWAKWGRAVPSISWGIFYSFIIGRIGLEAISPHPSGPARVACVADADCASSSGFCNRGRCAPNLGPGPQPSHFGEACASKTANDSPPSAATYECGKFLCQTGRCSSCTSDGECTQRKNVSSRCVSSESSGIAFCEQNPED